MSSALQVALTSVQQNNYVSLAIITAVAYDYVLTFTKEIEYIWDKRWTSVSTLFIFVRYCGLYCLILPSLVGSTFIPGPAKAYVFFLFSFHGFPLADLFNSCEIINIIYGWAFLLFLGAADFVMILRVWAMYNQSRLILAILLTLFFLEVFSTLIGVIVYSNPERLSAAIIQIQDVSFCVVQPNSVIWTKVSVIFQSVHNTVLCFLAVAQFVKQSHHMYGTTKRWQPNRYVTLFVKEGILYFFAMLLFDTIDVLGTAGQIPTGGWQLVLTTILANVPVYTLTPRFIISMRELYARDIQSDHASGIDTCFGLSTLYDHDVGGIGMVFADGQNEEMDDAM